MYSVCSSMYKYLLQAKYSRDVLPDHPNLLKSTNVSIFIHLLHVILRPHSVHVSMWMHLAVKHFLGIAATCAAATMSISLPSAR